MPPRRRRRLGAGNQRQAAADLANEDAGPRRPGRNARVLQADDRRQAARRADRIPESAARDEGVAIRTTNNRAPSRRYRSVRDDVPWCVLTDELTGGAHAAVLMLASMRALGAGISS